MTPHVRYQVEGGVARLTIDREDIRNALSSQTIEELVSGLNRADADSGVRCVVLTGAGEKVFCAGGQLDPSHDGIVAAHNARRSFGQLLHKFQEICKPTVARVNGHALAGGMGLVLACDLAIAAVDVGFGTPEIDRGLFPMTVMALLQRHLGRKRTLELVLTGDRLTAEQAQAWGLVNRVVPRAQLDSATQALAEQLCGKSQAVLALGRRAYFASEGLPLNPAYEFLASHLSLNALTDDAAEGVTAFLEKRPPAWQDR